MSVLANSRNLLTQVVQVVNPLNGALVRPPFVNLRPRVTQTAPDDQFLTLDSSMSWGSLGFSYLGDARYWWAFADISNVVDPLAELVAGAQVRGPSVPRLLFTILAPTATSGETLTVDAPAP